ncbi:TPA: hypothetical protein JRX33_002677 [Elizabethkingia anophelis]|nr:hypothetical protein [Elizabethkingia anophelis]
MDRKFRTPFSSMDDKNPISEKNIGKSETVPDQSLTVRQILDKFSTGTLDEIARDKFYNDDDDLPDLRGLDITELQQMKRDAQMDIDEIQAMIDLHEDVQTLSPTNKKVKSDPSPTDTLITETPDHI